MTSIFNDDALQLHNVPPAKRFNELILQNQREESLLQIVSGIYYRSNVIDDAIPDENRNPRVGDPGAQTLEIQKVTRSFPVPIFRRLLPNHAT